MMVKDCGFGDGGNSSTRIASLSEPRDSFRCRWFREKTLNRDYTMIGGIAGTGCLGG